MIVVFQFKQNLSIALRRDAITIIKVDKKLKDEQSSLC